MSLLVLGLLCWGHIVRWAPNQDASTYVIEAQRLLNGGKFFQDILETNPPLIVFLTAPAVEFAKWTGGDAWAAFTVWVGIIVFAACAFSTPYIQRAFPGLPGWLCQAVTLWSLAILPGYDFGQREHLSVCLFLPALCQFATRSAEEGATNTTWSSILMWLVAGIGLLLKPFFLAVIGALLLHRAWQRRDWRVLFGVEGIVVAVATLVYAAVIWFGFHGWVDTVELTTQVYFGFNEPMSTVLLKLLKHIVLWCFAVGVVWWLPGSNESRRFLGVLLGAAGVWLAVAILQSKGWLYHALPVLCLVAISQALAAFNVLWRADSVKAVLAARPALRSQVWLTGLISLGLILAIYPRFYVVKANGRQWLLSQPFARAMQQYGAGKPWVAWTTSVPPSFPLAVMMPGTWASRNMHQWMVPGTVKLRSGSPEDVARAGRLQLTAAKFATEDLKRWRPAVVAIKKSDLQKVDGHFDFLHFFAADPEFSAEWSHYRLQEHVPEWDFYVRTGASGQ